MYFYRKKLQVNLQSLCTIIFLKKYGPKWHVSAHLSFSISIYFHNFVQQFDQKQSCNKFNYYTIHL